MKTQAEVRKIYRLLDANFNRTKEGLRVCEDICRFFLNQGRAAQRYKLIRHNMVDLVYPINLKRIIQSRDVKGDVGKSSVTKEMKRGQVSDIFYANSQRIKESMRVLEEFAKLFNFQTSHRIKQLRYQIYELEKKIVNEC